MQNITEPGEIRCPKCLGQFDADQAALKCTACGASYAMRDGILDLRGGRLNYYFNPVPRAEMARLVDGMTPENWPQTIRKFLGYTRNPTEWLDNLVIDGRYAWKLLLDLNPQTVMLDLGCGLGNLTHNLAPFVRRVYALDLTYERLAFSGKRFANFNAADDIRLVAGGDGAHLPFAEASLDCVVVSGVLEWVGEGDVAPFRTGGKLARLWRMLAYQYGARGPRAIQLAFLREIRRVLKPTGQLFVAIENRTNYEYFAGRPDHHSRLKYGSLLPRTLANLYSIAKRRAPYRTYTHTLRGYRKLLREAGFPATEFIGFFQGYSHLREMLPCAVEVPMWQPEPAKSLKARIQRNPRFVPAYGITAGASATKPWRRLQDQLIAAVQQDLAAALGAGQLVIRRYMVSGKDKLFLRCTFDNHEVHVKIPLNEAARLSETNNAHVLERLAAEDILPGRIPRSLGKGSASGLTYFIESGLSGNQLASQMHTHGRARHIAEVADLLDGLRPAGGSTHPLDDLGYHKEIESRLTRVLRHVEDSALRDRAERFFRKRLLGAQAAWGWFHGDFGGRNILVHDRGVSGLIDWEGGAHDGLPVLDAINYLVSAHIACNPRDRLDRAIPLLASGEWPVREEWDFLQARYAQLGMDMSCHIGWTYLYWLHAVDTKMPNHLQYSAAGIGHHVNSVIASMPEI